MRTVEGLTRSTSIDGLKANALQKLADELGATGAGVLEVAHKQKDVEETKKKIEKANAQIAASEKDLERWRENLKAAGGGEKGGAPQNLVTRVLQLEDKRDKLQASLEPLEAELATRTAALRVALEKLGK
jgi:chromosome segregation ATPase